jgi:hypothetical protein
MRFIGGAVGHEAATVPIIRDFQLVENYKDDDIDGNNESDEEENTPSDEEPDNDENPVEDSDECGPEDGENENWIDEEFVIPEDNGYGGYD